MHGHMHNGDFPQRVPAADLRLQSVHDARQERTCSLRSEDPVPLAAVLDSVLARRAPPPAVAAAKVSADARPPLAPPAWAAAAALVLVAGAVAAAATRAAKGAVAVAGVAVAVAAPWFAPTQIRTLRHGRGL